MARVELIERSAQLIVTPRMTRERLVHALPQRGAKLRDVPAAHGDAAAIARVAGPCFEHVQAALDAPEAMMYGGIEAFANPIDVPEELILATDH